MTDVTNATPVNLELLAELVKAVIAEYGLLFPSHSVPCPLFIDGQCNDADDSKLNRAEWDHLLFELKPIEEPLRTVVLVLGEV
ncbi:hypothetical protein DVK06_08860 [Halorubrum sp. Atlit-28R]|nr:hypothetical protein DVK06_08860 [Halorubrum sp. Atlit-28R]